MGGRRAGRRRNPAFHGPCLHSAVSTGVRLDIWPTGDTQGHCSPPSLGQTPRQRLGAATLQGTRHGSHGLLRHASQRQHRHHHHAEGGSDWLCTASLCARTTTKRKGFQMKRNDAKSRVWNGTAMAHGTSRGLHSTRRLGVSISSFSVHRSCPMVGEPWQFIWSLVC